VSPGVATKLYASALEEALDTDRKLVAQIFFAARRHLWNEADAMDLAQRSIEHAIILARKTGEPKPPKTFMQFVGSFLNGNGANARRTLKRKPPPVAYDEEVATHTKEKAPDAHEVLTRPVEDEAEDRFNARVEEEVFAHFTAEGEAGDLPLAMLKLASEQEGDKELKNQEMADRLQRKVRDIENAKKRIGRAGAAAKAKVRAELGGTP